MRNKLLRFASLIFLVSCTQDKAAVAVKEDTKSFKINLTPGDSTKDPLLNLNQERLKVLSLVFEPLLSYTQGGTEIVPTLLSELPTLSADQQTYTFKLKSGLAFHPSNKLEKSRVVSSKDVVMSLLRGVIDQNSSNYGSLLTGLVDGLAAWTRASTSGEWYGKNLPSGIQIKNESEFSIRLLRKYPDFLALLTLPAFAILPHELLVDGKLSEAVGTGPYKFSDTIVNSREWSLVGSEQLKFPSVTITESPDVKDVQASDYSSLPLKLAAQIIDPATGALKDLPDHTLQELSLRRLEILVFNLKDPLVKGLGVDFRRAIMSVIDLESVLNNMYRGFSLNLAQFIPPGVEGSLSEVKMTTYTFEEAQKKIAKALKNKKLKVTYPESAAYWITELQKNLEKVGPYFEFQAIEATAYLDQVGKGEFQFAPLSWEGDLPEATNFLQLYYGGSQANEQNLSGYRSPAFDSSFNRLSKLFPSPERRKLAETAHALVLKDLPVIPLGFKKEFAVLSKRAAQLNTKAFGASSLKEFLVAP